MRKFTIGGVLFLMMAGMSLAESVTGYVTDAACGAKGRGGADHKACAQKCAAKGQDLVLVTDDKKVLKIHNRDAVKDLVGDKITAEGKVEGDSIHIDSAKAAM
jgi:hypothetical protein